MKTLRITSILSLFMAFATVSFAQTKSETIPVSGNCKMCKANIEKAAKQAGATTADWNVTTKMLTVNYNSSSTNAAKIQQGIAGAGYDTRDFKATDEAYNKLHACCQYDRAAASATKHQCSETCQKDGSKDKGCCKDADESKAAGCCKDSKTESHNH